MLLGTVSDSQPKIISSLYFYVEAIRRQKSHSKYVLLEALQGQGCT